MNRPLAALATLFLTTTLALAQTAPATAPADLSTPKGAIKAFLSAKDEAALRAAVATPQPGDADVTPFLDTMAATIRLQNAAEKQYGSSSAQYFSKGTDAMLASRIKAVEAADVQINGNTATVHIVPEAGSKAREATVLVRKSDSDWKVDAASLFQVTSKSPEEIARQTRVAKAILAVTNQTILDMEAHKFGSAGDAYNEYWTRSSAAVKRLDSSATQPAR